MDGPHAPGDGTSRVGEGSRECATKVPKTDRVSGKDFLQADGPGTLHVGYYTVDGSLLNGPRAPDGGTLWSGEGSWDGATKVTDQGTLDGLKQKENFEVGPKKAKNGSRLIAVEKMPWTLKLVSMKLWMGRC